MQKKCIERCVHIARTKQNISQCTCVRLSLVRRRERRCRRLNCCCAVTWRVELRLSWHPTKTRPATCTTGSYNISHLLIFVDGSGDRPTGALKILPSGALLRRRRRQGTDRRGLFNTLSERSRKGLNTPALGKLVFITSISPPGTIVELLARYTNMVCVMIMISPRGGSGGTSSWLSWVLSTMVRSIEAGLARYSLSL